MRGLNQWPELILVLIYFASRLIQLTRLPMFVDEAIHLKWAIKGAEQGQFPESIEGFRFFPVLAWSQIVPLASHNLLWAGRLVAVLFGAFGLLGCYLLAKKLFNRRVALIAGSLYLIVPYTFFHDRMILVDGLLAVWAIYVMLFSLMLLRRPGLVVALCLGLVLGLAAMTKINGFMLGVLPVIVFASQPGLAIRNRSWKWLISIYGVAILAAAVSFLLLNFSLEWWQIGQRLWLNEDERSATWLIWLINSRDMFLYLAYNLTIPIFILIFIGIGLAVVEQDREVLLLVTAAAAFSLFFVVLSKPGRWYPRYLLPAVPFLLLLVARVIDRLIRLLEKQLARKWVPLVVGGSMLLISLPTFWFDFKLITDPAQAPFVAIDKWQYVQGIHAGYGLPEVAGYLREQLESTDQIIVVYDNRPSALPDILQVYLYDRRERLIHVRYDLSETDPNYLMGELQNQTKPVILVLSDPPSGEPTIEFNQWPTIKHVMYHARPGNLTGVHVYQARQEETSLRLGRAGLSRSADGQRLPIIRQSSSTDDSIALGQLQANWGVFAGNQAMHSVIILAEKPICGTILESWAL